VDTNNIFKADRNQALAVVAMLASAFTFAMGEFVIGFICIAVAALFSLGGLFWNAHRADQREAADAQQRKSDAAGASNGARSAETNKD
jgi:high-affinity Fe2+/Pb2+ permease